MPCRRNLTPRRSTRITFWGEERYEHQPDGDLQAGHRGFSGAVSEHYREPSSVHRLRRFYNDVITNISTGTTPNVCITYPDHIATLHDRRQRGGASGRSVRGREVRAGRKRGAFRFARQDEIVPQFLEECSIAGHYYAVPYMRSTEACYINKDYVEALGYTLPETLTWISSGRCRRRLPRRMRTAPLS